MSTTNPATTEADCAEPSPKAPKTPTGRYTAGLVVTGVVTPMIAAIITVAAYVVPAAAASPRATASLAATSWVNTLLPILIGSSVAIAFWLLAAVPFGRNATAERAYPSTYRYLYDRFRNLKDQLDSIDPQPKSQSVTAPAGGNSGAVALKEARGYEKAIECGFKGRALPWVQATGYIRVQNLIHGLEEALIEIEPCEVVINDAVVLESRLEGSTMDNREQLLDKLRRAAQQVSPSAVMYLDKPPPAQNDGGPTPASPPNQSALAQGGSAQAAPTQGATAQDAPRAAPDCCPQAQARTVIREVCHAVNEYRDNQREGLVQARNRVAATTALTGFTVYMLLGLAIIWQAPPKAIVAAAAFYIVGALIGLFNRLRIQARDTATIDDFWLPLAQLNLTQLLSGLAAVGGVLITAYGVVYSSAAATQTAQRIPTPNEIYDLRMYPFGLIVAAVFGLSPGLLLSGLQQQVNKYKDALTSTEVPTRKGP